MDDELQPTDAHAAALLLADAATRGRAIVVEGSGTKRRWCRTAADRVTLSSRHLADGVEHFAGDLVATIDLLGGPERILFASDWPHHDFDHPRAILKLPMPREAKRKIMGENALQLFGIPAPAGKVATG